MKTVFDIKIGFEKSHGSFAFDKNQDSEFLDFYCIFSSVPLVYNCEKKSYQWRVCFWGHISVIDESTNETVGAGMIGTPAWFSDLSSQNLSG